MKSCIIIGAGELTVDEIVCPPEALVIAADGGYSYCERLGIVPDIIIGDFDSLGKIPDGKNVVHLPVEKDDTDTSSAVKMGLNAGCSVFHIYGGTGGRLDHTLANIQIITGLAQNKKNACLYGKDFIITAVTDSSLHFDKGMHGIVSVFSAGDTAKGVYETGLKYSLTDALLTNTFPVGVSNELIGEEADISVRAGTLIIVYPKC